MSDVLADIGTALVLLGVVIFTIGAVGLLRLPDVYARLSAVTMAGGLGVILMIIGVLLHHPTPMNTLKVALAIIIQLGTAAVGGNAMARAGYLTDAPRTPATRYDDLATATAGPSAPSVEATTTTATTGPATTDITPVDGDHRTGPAQ